MSYIPDRTQPHQESERVTETKNKIKKAFFQLHKEKKIEKISIKEITDLAGINRGTFYVYYMDIYDLHEKLQEEVKSLMEEFMKNLVARVIRERDIAKVIPPQEVFEENKDLLSLFLGEKADPEFVKSVKAMAKEYVLKTLHINPDKLPLKSRYVIEYIASGQYGVVSFWFQQGMQIPISEFAPMLKLVNFHGPIKQLLKLSNLKGLDFDAQ